MQPYDLVIIGAGIIGAMAAYLAAEQRPDWRILLIDRSIVGSGATQYSAGLDIPYGRTPRHRQLASESAAVYHELRHAIPDLPIHEQPLCIVAGQAHMAEVLGCLTQGGVHPTDEQELQHLRRSYPDLTIAPDEVVLAGCSGNYAFPQLVAAALVSRFREQRHTACWEGVAIHGLSTLDNRYVLSTADGRTISARRVLIATGPWLPFGPGAEVARHAGVRIKKVAALHIDRCPQPRDPIVFFIDHDAFLLPIYERREWLFSFASQEWDCLPESSQLAISAADRDLALSILSRYCPMLAAHCHGGRVFCDAYSTDRVPLIASASEATDVVIAGACAGSGYRLAPGIAKTALRLLSSSLQRPTV